MNSALKRLLIVGLILVTTIAAYGYYVLQGKAENKRLLEIALTSYESAISVPTGSTLVYQEQEVSRICKTVGITKLFSTDRAPEDVCESILVALKSQGWKSSSGCQVTTYPFKRSPIDGDRPSYTYSRFDAGAPSTRFGVSVTANPHDAWGPLLMLSNFGEQEAIPLARKQGKTFFTVKLKYRQDRSLIEKHCPENLPRCDCVERSLFAWKFSDGREFSRSD